MRTILSLCLALVQSAWVHLYREGDQTYVAKVTIGAETFSLQVSTISSLSFVTAVECRNCFQTGGYRKGYSTNQDSFRSMGPTAEDCFSKLVTDTKECGFIYTDNTNYTASGALSTDSFKFGGVEIPEVVFGRVFQEQNYEKRGIDGILGFGPGDLLLTYGLSIEERLLKQQSLKDVFSLCFDEEEGLMYIGGVNSKIDQTVMVRFPMSSSNRYSLPLASLTVQTGPNLLTMSLDAVIDTTYSYLALPEFLIEKMIEEFRLFYAENCTLSTCSQERNILKGFPIARPAHGFPKISIAFGTLTIEFEDYIFPCENSAILYCSMIVQSPHPGLAILGSTVLTKLELVIDREHASIL